MISEAPFTVAEAACGAVPSGTVTASVASLASGPSGLPASSVNEASTRIRLPSSSMVGAKVWAVSPGMGVLFEVPSSSTLNHWYVQSNPLSPLSALVLPSGSVMPAVSAVSVRPTRASPVIVGLPVAGSLARLRRTPISVPSSVGSAVRP